MSGSGTATGNVEVTFSAVGVDAIRRSFVTVGQDALRMGRVTEEAGRGAEGLTHHLEHLGVAGAFAIQSLANGTETGVHRALHAIAQLGFSFGGGWGIAATAVALATNSMIQNFEAAKEAAKKAAEEFDRAVDQMVNAGNNAAIKMQAQDIWKGTAAERAKGEMGLGGLESMRDDLVAMRTEIERHNPFFNLTHEWQQLDKTIKATEARIDPLREKFDVLMKAISAPPPNGPGGIAPMVSTALSPAQEAKNAEAADKARRDELEKRQRQLNAFAQVQIGFFMETTLRDAKARTDAADAKQKEYDANLSSYERFLKQLDDAANQANNRDVAREEDIARQRQARIERQSAQISDTVAGAFDAVISNGGGFRKLSDFVLAQMGHLFVAVGEKWVAAGSLMTIISDAFTSFDGSQTVLGGLALIALGSAIGSAAGRGGSGGSSPAATYSAPLSRHTYGSIDPTKDMAAATGGLAPQQPLVFSPTIIGANDPQAQRMLWEMGQKFAKRQT